MKNNKVKYIHANIPPTGIEVNKHYFIDDIFDKLKLSEEIFKTLFEPVDGKWETEKKNNKRQKKITQE